MALALVTQCIVSVEHYCLQAGRGPRALGSHLCKVSAMNSPIIYLFQAPGQFHQFPHELLISSGATPHVQCAFYPPTPVLSSCHHLCTQVCGAHLCVLAKNKPLSCCHCCCWLGTSKLLAFFPTSGVVRLKAPVTTPRTKSPVFEEPLLETPKALYKAAWPLAA